MQEIVIIIGETGSIIVETDDGEEQFATADEALDYVRSFLPGAEAGVPDGPAGDVAPDPGAAEQAMWDEEAAARAPTH